MWFQLYVQKDRDFTRDLVQRAAGAEGVARVVQILRKEFELAMALLGRPTLASIDRSVLW